MSHFYAPCTRCQRVPGFYTCPGCLDAFCFDHCIGHGCQSQSSTPTVAQEISSRDAWRNLYHPWLWERLHRALHSVGTLHFFDEHCTVHMALKAPVIGASVTHYTYAVYALNAPPTVGVADSLEDLAHGMPVAHQRLLYNLLGVFVERQRAGLGQANAGQALLKIHADAVAETTPAFAQNTAKTLPIPYIKE